ncbi:MAG: glycerophosphodiester phosphodiesterase family protein [Planctomycetota bacterium]
MRANLGRLVAFDLAFKAASLLLLTPLFELGLHALLTRSGNASVTNADIASFAFSPAGVGFLLLLGCSTVGAVFAEQAGLMLVLAGVRPRDAIRTVLVSIPRLLTVAAAQLAWLALALAPLLIGAAITYATFLTEHDINWYLATRPPAWTTALLIVGALAIPTVAVLAVLLVRWAFSVPVCLFEKQRGFAALRRSRDLGRGRTGVVAKPILGWVATVFIGSTALLMLFDLLASLVLAPFSAPGLLVVLTMLLLGAAALISFLVSLAAAGGYAAITLRLYGKQVQPPPVQPRRSGWIALAVALVVSTGVGYFVVRDIAENITSTVTATAHRGSSIDAPENSIAAIRRALEDRADYCEIDVQELKDGTIVLIHDTDFKRVTGRAGRVGDTSYDEIKDLDSGSWFDPRFKDERIPTLEQVIDLVAGKMKLNIELKYHGKEKAFEERVIEIVRRKEFSDRCVITSLEAKGLRRVRSLAPEFRIGQIVTVAFGRVQGLDVDFLSMNANKASAFQIKANRAAGMETHVWTVNDRSMMHRMIERGADNIITDVPATLRAVIDARAEMSDVELLLLALGHRLRD